jgi:hypothetical protein
MMANDSFSSDSVPAKTDKEVEVATPAVVATHIGRNKVGIDTIALKHLIDRLRATFRARS